MPEATASSSTPQARPQKASSGTIVSDSGIYRLWHLEHELQRELILLRGMEFPKCPRCDAPIYYELLMAAPYAGDDPDFAGMPGLRKR